MTRKHLRRILTCVIAVYATAFLAGILLRFPYAEVESPYYKTFKDLLPVMIAIPAAYLAWAFQRRSSYVQTLRALWTNMVNAVAAALAYTELRAPSEDQHMAVLTKLSITIEEVRGVFTNVPVATAPNGWYPFEPIKQIYQAMKDLGFGEMATAESKARTRAEVFRMWKDSRKQLLAEFDREMPTHHHAQYSSVGPRHGAAAEFPKGL
ncbi:MAG: hypothetical protein ACO1Q7_04420 [Gemmatimonas sp.]